jgi:hypothetical protein
LSCGLEQAAGFDLIEPKEKWGIPQDAPTFCMIISLVLTWLRQLQLRLLHWQHLQQHLRLRWQRHRQLGLRYWQHRQQPERRYQQRS